MNYSEIDFSIGRSLKNAKGQEEKNKLFLAFIKRKRCPCNQGGIFRAPQFWGILVEKHLLALALPGLSTYTSNNFLPGFP